MIEELWVDIPEFPNYQVSSLGRIYNTRTDRLMSVSVTNHGHPKITLTDDDGERYTRSVALLVADAFVPGKDHLSDQVILLDGDLNNVQAHNMAWRPRWFAWKYTRQLRTDQPRHYHNLPVIDLTTNIEYECVVHAGMEEGLLFATIWRSTYTRHPVYPTDSVFEVLQRV